MTCTVLITGMNFPYHAKAAESMEVKVQVNDELVHFPDAQPFLDPGQCAQVPVRFVTEKLGYALQWQKHGDEINVTLQNDKHTVTLTTGQDVARIDNQSVPLESAAEYQDGRVYVPLRFISEAADVPVQWDADSKLAILSKDGQYHAPDYEIFEASAYTADPSENGGYAAYDYMGNPLMTGTVAVDPSVIPLGSKLYIEGYDSNGLPAGGMYAYATDIGGAVKGKHLDIFIPGKASAIQFGLQQIKVYRLSN